MKVTTEKKEPTEATLTVELEPGEMDRAMDEAYHRLVRKANIPGFRKGKAPRRIVEQTLGRESLIEEALRNDLTSLWTQAVRQENLNIVSRPEIEIVQVEPITFKAKVYLYPEVTLGNYREIRGEPGPVAVTDEDINKAIEDLRRDKGSWEPVSRPSAAGDLVIIDFKGTLDGETVVDRKNFEYEMVAGSPVPLPGFVENLTGLQKDEEKEFELSFATDYADKKLAGKKYLFKVKVLDIKERKLPELNDEFIQSLGQELKTVDDLKNRVRENLTTIAADRSRKNFEEEVLTKIINASEVKYPAIMVEQEIDKIIYDQVMQHFGAGKNNLANYLKYVGKTAEELRNELQPVAAGRITRALIIDKIVKEEKIEVPDSELEQEIEKMAGSAGDKGKDIAKAFQSAPGKESLRQILLNNKTMARIAEIAKSEKPEGEKQQ